MAVVLRARCGFSRNGAGAGGQDEAPWQRGRGRTRHRTRLGPRLGDALTSTESVNTHSKW